MFCKRLLTLVMVVVCLVGGLTEVRAQESATIQALATVISGLTISGDNNLLFTTVIPGVSKVVDKSDPGFAGQWTVTGAVGAEVTIDFTLPDSLIHAADSTNGMPISFSSVDASFDDGTGGGQLSPVGVLDPNGLGVEYLGGSGQLTVWIGGTVSPRISQTGGDYAETVMLSVAYTGN